MRENKEQFMNRDDLCSFRTTFIEDEKYILSRYDTTDQDLFF